MKKKQIVVFGTLLLIGVLLSGCAGTNNEENPSGAEAAASVSEKEETEVEVPGEAKTELPDGVYTAEFTTDNSMFRVNEAYEDKGTLTVENGEMTIHISLGSKNIVNLYPGLAEDAQKDGAELLFPTVDTVTYSDGWVQEVYGFDIPVPVLDEEFDVALIGKKGKWYDHKVKVSNPKPLTEEAVQTDIFEKITDGNYSIELTFEGGSGKAEVLSPATIVVSQGTVTATIQWSSPNYDYMIVDGEKYLPTNTEGNSVFVIPVLAFDQPIDIIGDTVAMSKPHEVEYTITFHADTIKAIE